MKKIILLLPLLLLAGCAETVPAPPTGTPDDQYLCGPRSAPVIGSGPESFTGSAPLRWSISGGCIGGREWGVWSLADRNLFIGTKCSLLNRAENVAEENVVVSDQRMVSLPGSGESFSATPPESCRLSSASLPAGRYYLEVRKVLLEASPLPLGGWAVEEVDRSPRASLEFQWSRTVPLALRTIGSGQIQTDREGCPGPDCRVPVGGEISLEATPGDGWRWQGWSLADCENASCTVEIWEPQEIAARFAERLYTLTVSSTREPLERLCPDPVILEQGTRIGDAALWEGAYDLALLTENPPSCQEAADVLLESEREDAPPSGWGIRKGGEGRAVFERAPGSGFVVRLQESNPGGVIEAAEGDISCGEVCSERFAEGDTVELRADPGDGYVFVSWTGDCQGASPRCTVEIAGDRNVGAVWAEIVRPEIIGPEVVSGDPTWRVLVPGGGETECQIDEVELYTSGASEEMTDGDTRRYDSPCSDPASSEFTTPSFWRGRSGEPVEQNGVIGDLPDGEYRVIARRAIFADGELLGLGQDSKTFFLDRRPPESARISGAQEVDGDTTWEIRWGRDLTQEGALESGEGSAGIRCRVVSLEGTTLLESSWGECGTDPDQSATPLLWPGGAYERNSTGSLPEGRYRLIVEQRDRAGQIRSNALPIQKVQRFSEGYPGEDSVRFGARWQNVFVADTRPPSGSEGLVGETWHPLRCSKGGVGLLLDCVDAENPEEVDLLGTEIWEGGFLVPEGEGSYRAQGYVRLATPGRFESERGERRTLHARLIIDSALRARERDAEWYEGDPYCNSSGAENPFDIALQASRIDCTDGFPVRDANVYLRSAAEGIIVEGEEEVAEAPASIEQRPEFEVQNAITGNAEIHICQPGVPRGLEGEEIPDVWDGEPGRLVPEERSSSVLGPSPDRDCEGYLLVWRWNGEVAREIGEREEGGVIAPGPEYKIYSGDISRCSALPSEESTPPPPRLEDMSSSVATALLQRVGSYRSWQDLPYQRGGETIWEAAGGSGDPLLLSSAPWSPEGRVWCSGSSPAEPLYLSPEWGRWSLWLPGGEEPALDELAKAALPPVVGPGFGRGLFALPLPSDIDGDPLSMDEGLMVDFDLAPAPAAPRGEDAAGYYWFMDARYYGYHLQRWAYSTELDSTRRDIEVLVPRSSR